MGRKPVGDHALSAAERQAWQRTKRAAARKALVAALEDVLRATRLAEAKQAGRRALEALRRI